MSLSTFAMSESTKNALLLSGSEDGQFIMSIAQNPLTGQMRKSMGNFNTYVHRGQNVVSTKAFNRKDKNTEAQQAQRASFKLIADLYQSLGGYVDYGFPVCPERMSPYNYFMYLNLPNAIDTSGEMPEINYSLLKVAKGTLPSVNVMNTTLDETCLTLSCESNADFPKAAADDVVTLLVGAKSGALYATRQVRGSEEYCSISQNLPNLAKADIQYIYLFVTTADGKKASNTIYVSLVD